LSVYFVIEFFRPILQAVSVILLVVCGAFAARPARSWGLLLLSLACSVSAAVTLVYLIGSLQTEWKITLLPVAARRATFIVADILYIIEVCLWPAAIIAVVREHRASGTRTI
jgi:hypothetical protein